MSKFKEPKIVISKVYTKKGDKGSTCLIGGEKVSKNDLRVTAYGEVDELNVYVGLCASHISKCPAFEQKNYCLERLTSIQNELFNLGTVLASAGSELPADLPSITDEDVRFLEKDIDKMNLELEPLKSFILPGNNRLVLSAHLARVVCRRAEKYAVSVASKYDNLSLTIEYLNRLSDYFFVLGRFLAKKNNIDEELWSPNNISSKK